MRAPHTLHPGAEGGLAGAGTFAKKHMVLMGIIGIGVLLVFVLMRRGGGTSASTITYPDTTASGSPLPSGASGISDGSGVGGTQDPSGIFSSFLAGFQFGSQFGGPDSAGASNPLPVPSSSLAPITIPDPAVPNISSHLAKSTGVSITKIVPPHHSITEPRHSSSVKTTSHHSQKTGTGRVSKVARTSRANDDAIMAVRANRMTGTSGTPIKHIAQPSHTGTHHTVVSGPQQHAKSTGTHMVTKAVAKHKGAGVTKPITPGHTTFTPSNIARQGPKGNTIPHIDPLHSTSVPRMTPIPVSHAVTSHPVARRATGIAQRANTILKPVLTIPGKVPAAAINKAGQPTKNRPVINPVAKTKPVAPPKPPPKKPQQPKRTGKKR